MKSKIIKALIYFILNRYPAMKAKVQKLIDFLKTYEGITMAILFAISITGIITGMFHHSSGLTLATVIAGVAGGSHVIDGPLTIPEAKEGSPDLLRSELDSRIVKIRPMSTPIDQISRMGKARHSGSMVVEYYSVDTKETTATLTEAVSQPVGTGSNGTLVTTIHTDNDEIFEASETIVVPAVNVNTGTDATGNFSPLVLYVVDRTDDALRVTAANHKNSQGAWAVPNIPSGAKLVRMGRAAGELDVQTGQFQSLPVKASNNCQIFKAQVEQSTLMKLANKEVGWTFSDQEEAAIVDMRMGMEKNFLFGAKARIYDPIKHSEVLLTGGIWNQAGRQWTYSTDALTEEKLIDLCMMAFTRNAGSARKVLIGGSKLIGRLNKIESVRVVGATQKKTVWGLDFSEIVSKFGTLYVIASEIFDECGHENDGIVIDPEYITKYSHIPFRTEKLDLRSSGVRNTDAIVITEASCLVLRYPEAHMRISYLGVSSDAPTSGHA